MRKNKEWKRLQTIVVKFGGPMLATTEKIVQVAKKVIKEQGRGINLVVVVSSMTPIRQNLRQFAAWRKKSNV